MKFALREVEDQDHEWLVELHNDPVVLRNVTDPNPITLEQHLAWWDRTKNRLTEHRAIFTVDDVRVGFTKFYNIDRTNLNCVLGADIHKDFRGRGYAKSMWGLMLDSVFNFMRFRRASLTTAEYNLIGLRVYLGLGFREEGRLVQSLYRDGKYYDQICMYMLDEDWPTT